MPPHRLGFLSGFGLKTGIDFAHFGLESGMVFERRTYSIPNEKERELSDFENLFLLLFYSKY